jgi:hypothetical protein
MTKLDGAREGVRTEGTRAKEELRKDSSKSARSSLTDGEERRNSRRNEGIINHCSMIVENGEYCEGVVFYSKYLYSISRGCAPFM